LVDGKAQNGGEDKMKPEEYISFLSVIEKLKCNTRHSWTSSGRAESVAEHSWRLAVMALLCADEFPKLDINKVIKMCLIHDFGEALTGDVPSFWKTDEHEEEERRAIESLLGRLPEQLRSELGALFAEMEAKETQEAKLYKALDNMEAVVSHNEAPISTWLPREYEENLIYGEENAAFSAWTKKLREVLKDDSLRKIEREAPSNEER
jgi:putative hydrolase of HD superfamily